MKLLFFLIYLLSFTQLIAQQSFNEADARQLVDTFFEGFHDGDTTKMRSVMVPSAVMQTASATVDGKNMVSEGSVEKLLDAIANRPPEQIWEEKILDYKVQIDGNLAHVWTPYEFWFNGNFSHCGANAFTMAKTDQGWKIIHLIDSRRKEGCLKE